MGTPILTIQKEDFFKRVGYNSATDTGLQIFKPGAMLFDIPTALVDSDIAEPSTELLQLIPMAVVRYWDGAAYKYLSYRESLKITNGLTHDVYTMEFKDHVYVANASGQTSYGVIAAVVVDIMQRQLDTTITPDQVSMSNYIVLYDPGVEDQQHLALAFTITVNEADYLNITANKTSTIDSLSWQGIKNIKIKDDTLVTQYDNWSQIFMDYFVDLEEAPPNYIDGVYISPEKKKEEVDQTVTPTAPTTVNTSQTPYVVK